MLKRQVDAINWNKIEDKIDEATFEKLTEQFWLSTRIPVANDVKDWNKLTDAERELYNHVFGGLTLLDTLQSEDGISYLLENTRTQHERAVLNNIQFMESVHAKSYSTIFTTLCSPKEINEIFEWTNNNQYLRKKADTIDEIYVNGSPLQKKAASVLLETFLFYSGFFTPLHYLGESKMMNVAEIIKLIIRDESVHGTYIGYKFQLGFNELSPEEQQELKDWIVDLAFELLENEFGYTKEVYSGTEWTPLVNIFLEYNLNKAMNNLGFEAVTETTAADVDPLVMNGISTSTANHDFFSQVGNGYLMGQVEPVTSDDFDIIDGLL